MIVSKPTSTLAWAIAHLNLCKTNPETKNKNGDKTAVHPKFSSKKFLQNDNTSESENSATRDSPARTKETSEPTVIIVLGRSFNLGSE